MSAHPRHLKQYELQEQLGWGSMAEVWKAFDTHLHRYVAIKLLHANLQEDPHFVERFEREARFIAALHHPNIVRVHDFHLASEEADGTAAYMVMEYVEGQTLAHYMNGTSRLGNIPHPSVLVQFFASICLAVNYAHQNGIIHRDLKPANILLDMHNTTNNPVGEPILTDFGIAKLLGVTAGTFTNAQLGTPLYISPEQASGYPGNEQSDIYSLGVILYEMVTGTLPFPGNDPIAVMKQHINAVPPAPRFINPNIPYTLESVILRCLAKQPGARFPNALSLASAIAESLNQPIPERLARPTTPIEVIDMPTYLTPPPTDDRPASPNAPPDATTIIRSATPPPISRTPVNKTPASADTPTLPSSEPQGSTPITPASSDAVARPGITPVFASAPSTPPVPIPSVSVPAIAAPPPLRPRRTRRRTGLIIGAVALAALALVGSLAVYFSGLFPAFANPLVGHAFFTSSGQLNDRAQGIADGLQIDLQNVQAPPAGKSYYLWLLSDKKILENNQAFVDLVNVHPPLLLTNNLPVHNNAIHYTYSGDAQHNNILAAVSRLLITLEDANGTPSGPSTDPATWKYYAQLPQEFVPGDPTQLRGIDHIRHLYYQETGTGSTPILARPGGLDIWTFRNIEKIMEWSLSARDDFNGTTSNYQLMHNQFIRVLDIVDGAKHVTQDITPGTPMLVDPRSALTSLLPMDGQSLKTTENDPPGDLAHMELHLNELVKAPDASPETRQIAQSIVDAIGNLHNDQGNGWMDRVHSDAKTLFAMSPAQLAQPNAQVLLEDLATNATYSYIGKLDPATNKVLPGILQIHDDIQKLAAFDITTQVPASL